MKSPQRQGQLLAGGDEARRARAVSRSARREVGAQAFERDAQVDLVLRTVGDRRLVLARAARADDGGQDQQTVTQAADAAANLALGRIASHPTLKLLLHLLSPVGLGVDGRGTVPRPHLESADRHRFRALEQPTVTKGVASFPCGNCCAARVHTLGVRVVSWVMDKGFFGADVVAAVGDEPYLIAAPRRGEKEGIAALLTQKGEPRKFSDKLAGLAEVRRAQDLALRLAAACRQHEAWLHHQRMAP